VPHPQVAGVSQINFANRYIPVVGNIDTVRAKLEGVPAAVGRSNWNKKTEVQFKNDCCMPMCGRVIQSSEPLRYAIVDGLNVRDPGGMLPRAKNSWSFAATTRPAKSPSTPCVGSHSPEPDPRVLMRRFAAEPMRMWPISTRVNQPENDDPSILEPVELATNAA
jgi:hypothetical protein